MQVQSNDFKYANFRHRLKIKDEKHEGTATESFSLRAGYRASDMPR